MSFNIQTVLNLCNIVYFLAEQCPTVLAWRRCKAREDTDLTWYFKNIQQDKQCSSFIRVTTKHWPKSWPQIKYGKCGSLVVCLPRREWKVQTPKVDLESFLLFLVLLTRLICFRAISLNTHYFKLCSQRNLLDVTYNTEWACPFH